ncbi:iron-containing alcohol dehydrogenase [Candidatus Flexifilum breve]|uniref:iron-containing alcohol dehydrogenase n=1 Tax=Candidatus Flexifilum breve TaxID=3140694 RepID=UPI003312F866
MPPKVALVDPELTHQLPKAITAATGMDAITQVIEPYTSNAVNPITDAIAFRGILPRRERHPPGVYHESDVPQAREQWRLPVCSAGCRWRTPSSGGARLRGCLGGMFDAPHGRSARACRRSSWR